VDIWGIHRRWIEHETGGYWDYCDFPLQHASLDEIESWPMPSPDDFDYTSIGAQCERRKDYCLYAGSAGMACIINTSGMIRGMEQTLVDLATDDEAGLRLADRRLDIQLEILARTLEAAQGRVDLLWLGEDLGTQLGQMISLDCYRKHIRPRHQRFVDLAKSWGIPVILHCCGSCSWAFDDFYEMGITIVDTLQPEAKDMAPTHLKSQYGDRFSFHGCISTAGPVAYGTLDDVVDDVRNTLAIMMPGGGYALAPTHNLQDNSPTENVVAMYETAKIFGRY